MLDLLKYLDTRLSEPSTWAGIAAMLGAAHIGLRVGLHRDAAGVATGQRAIRDL